MVECVRSQYQNLPLHSEAEFRALAVENNIGELPEDEHELILVRLQFELSERQRYIALDHKSCPWLMTYQQAGSEEEGTTARKVQVDKGECREESESGCAGKAVGGLCFGKHLMLSFSVGLADSYTSSRQKLFKARCCTCKCIYWFPLLSSLAVYVLGFPSLTIKTSASLLVVIPIPDTEA